MRRVAVTGMAGITSLGDCWADIEAAGNHVVARKAGGTLWAWGGNADGQLGDGTTDPRAARPNP